MYTAKLQNLVFYIANKHATQAQSSVACHHVPHSERWFYSKVSELMATSISTSSDEQDLIPNNHSNPIFFLFQIWNYFRFVPLLVFPCCQFVLLLFGKIFKTIYLVYVWGKNFIMCRIDDVFMLEFCFSRQPLRIFASQRHWKWRQVALARPSDSKGCKSVKMCLKLSEC